MLTTDNKNKMLEDVEVRVLRSFYYKGELKEGEASLKRAEAKKKGGKPDSVKPVHAKIPRWLAIELNGAGKVTFDTKGAVDVDSADAA